MSVLILACSRSGTKFTAELMQNLGYQFGHEEVLEDGGIGWQFAAEGHYNPKRIKPDPADYDRVLHQVRHPLDAIASMQTHTHGMKQWIAKDLGLQGLDSGGLRLLMNYWLEWNLRAEKVSSWTYQVESIALCHTHDSDQFLERVGYFRRIGIGELPDGDDHPHWPASNTNKRPHTKLLWSDLYEAHFGLAKDIELAARRYGYQ